MENKIDKYDLVTDSQYDNPIVETGEYYGGRKVYSRLLSISRLPNATTLTVNTGLSGLYHFWIDTSNSFAFNQGQSRYNIPYQDPQNHDNDISCRFLNPGAVSIVSVTNWSDYSAFICLKFTYA